MVVKLEVVEPTGIAKGHPRINPEVKVMIRW